MSSHTPLQTDSLCKAVIFDVDGTLVDSNDLHVEAWREAFAHYGIGLSYEQIHGQIGKGGDQLIPMFCSREQVDKIGEALDKHRLEIFTPDYLPQVQPFPKVRELFERLRSDGSQIALATSGKESELKTHLEKLGVEDLLDVTTSADDAEHSKPCPDIFKAAVGRLEGVAAAEALVVGDTPYDVIAASGVGMKTIALLSGRFPQEVLRDAGAAAIYVDIADLLEHYDDWRSGVGATAPIRA